MVRPAIFLIALLACAGDAAAQRRVTALGLAAGVNFSDRTNATAAFAGSLGFRAILSWQLLIQRTVADYDSSGAPGTQRDVSIALLPVWQPFGERLVVGAGGALHALRADRLDGTHERSTAFGVAALAGLRLPVAGPGIMVELLARADHFEAQQHITGLFGVRVRPGVLNTLQRGEPMSAPQVAARAAIWNDVLMQLIILQQSLESFSRIREIETGIELEFDLGAVTLYDDVAKAGRVLAAANPPVSISVFAPNAGRVAAAVTAGSFPPERIHLNRSDRLFLRVER